MWVAVVCIGTIYNNFCHTQRLWVHRKIMNENIKVSYFESSENIQMKSVDLNEAFRTGAYKICFEKKMIIKSSDPLRA